MTIWIDAQLSPSLAAWLNKQFNVDAMAVRDLGLLNASDEQIFEAARTVNAIVLTKDRDFLRLLGEKGSPPRVIWLSCGNTSNTHLKQILTATFHSAVGLLNAREELVEISETC